jgi:xanthine dehydrogenase accessory factor
MTDKEIFQKLSELKQLDIKVSLATVIECSGSTPREVGAKMIVCADGTIFGSIGGGCGENQVRSAALEAILLSKSPNVVDVDLTDDLGTRGGAVCGGKMRVLVETV